MKALAALLTGFLVVSAASAQSNLLPHANENLTAYKARMEVYFAPQIAAQGELALLSNEASEYNQYLRFIRYWEPRLDGVKGDFEKYMRQEYAAYNPSRRRAVPHASGGFNGGFSPRPEAIGGAWQEIGPIAKPASNVGAEGTGPTEFITFFDPAPSRMLCGSLPGGLFYSTNGGVTWSPTGTDTQIGRSGVASAVFHPTNYKTWFAASSGNAGDGDPMWIGYIGGIFRTTDEGATWKQIATQSQLGGNWTRIIKLAIDPANPQRVWAATSSGLYVTANALANTPGWTSVSYFAGHDVNDFEIRPGNSAWLYATTASYDSNNNLVGWSFVFSNNGGSSWQTVPNQPASTATASGLTIEVSPAKADNLYAFVIQAGGYPSELYIYDWGTGAWKLVEGFATMKMGSGHGFGVSAFNPNEIFLAESTEGRRYRYQGTPAVITYNSTYSSSGTYHPDIEDLVPHPVNPNEVWMCHHGGVSVSMDSGVTWSDRTTGIGATQTLKMAAAESDPSYVALGTYHDGTLMTASPWFNLWSPAWKQLQHSFCDGLRPLIDPTTPQYIWHSCQWGEWFESVDSGVTFNSNGPYSYFWISDGVLNSIDPKTQYRLGTDTNTHHTIMRTLDRGATWGQIADFAALPALAGREYILWKLYTPKTSGNYLLAHLLERPANSNVWWSHHLYRTKIANAAAAATIASWEELPLPVDNWLSEAGFDPANPNLVYIANSSSSIFTVSSTGTGMLFEVDYTTPSLNTLYSCTTGLCNNLTQNLPNAASGDNSLGVERNSNGGLYFVTDLGCWYSNTASRATGAGWSKLGTGLPHTGYNGLELNYVNHKVRVGSFGRGAWEHDLVPTVSSSCVQPPADMTGWWRFFETTGSVSDDSAGAVDNFGTRIGGPVSIAGKVGTALRFNGAAQYVDVPSDSEMDVGTGDFTIDAWIRTTQSGVQTIVDKRSAAPIGYSFFLFNGRPGLQLADRAGSSSCSANNAASACTNWVAPAGWPNIVDGGWHHVAVTVERNKPVGGRLYADGALVLVFDPTIRNLSLTNAASFWIAGSHAVSSFSPSYLTGDVDEVELIKRALTASEVQALYAADSLGKCVCLICQ